MMASPPNDMQHRFLGNTGLLLSKLSFGSFVTFNTQLDFEKSYAVLERAFKRGVNFFDTAEAYAGGQSEEFMGKIIATGIERGVWSREDLVLSTKIFFGTKHGTDQKAGPNEQGLSRKHIVEGTKASLKRLGLEYVDTIFCHRPDPCTPIEETVRAMNYVINRGWAFYWGTSEWSAHDIIEACEIADRLGLVRPVRACSWVGNGVGLTKMYDRRSINRSIISSSGHVLSSSTMFCTRHMAMGLRRGPLLHSAS
ncbi:hypothetical protein, variant [Phytophthora nicotianae CJ01A1]|uniref:NADP-dependent oxidoreductase domain-containing protein n=6 Tax=Phytophthora nicotianae TaxID=4792 RepID=W2Q1V0_PHYN3|nr:hypothetical protein, variant [Phytophthora nicotianae INRA-310]ETI43636.1 hypothetical protein, variant [Phytophthora nicotianae P1569]ETK83705.1 hypothetical protein, variant [Phytophthora nicotianae]ETO72294.1 hypothetical protein, variant [Phytophthora nicotianae P1976]ETP13452.1 hypothetical protein, variant [Phytophthora nicotianae CJ01A1]ETP41522.1 hypothetical protein, variant [Phytophthora nicotianae P10297]